jgi:hypothetical protein
MAFYFLYPASAVLSATLICSLAKMAPLPSEEASNRRSETNTSTEPSHATTSTPTPPSRSSISNEDNPFIQFRRFADAQFSSLLQSVIGLPSLFEHPSPTARWIVIKRDGDGNEVCIDGDKETMRQRRELEEGWRKQREQEAEERARAADAGREDEMRKWGCNVDAAAGHTPATKATSLGTDKEASKKNGGLLDWLGWDGDCEHEDKQEDTDSWNTPLTMPSIRMSVHDDDRSESLNPFSGRISEAVSWLLTNEYSPIFLRGHIPKDVPHDGPSFYHALHHPHWPDFRAASSPDRFEDELRFRVPWCDAFEDLVSLQNNGHMVDRDEPTRTSSAQWLNDMIKRGSLGNIMGTGAFGPQWSTEYARTVLPFIHSRQPQHIPAALAGSFDLVQEPPDDVDEFNTDPVLSAFEVIKKAADLDDNDGSDIVGHTKDWIQEFSDSRIQAVAKDLMKPGVLDELRRLGFASHVQVIDHLFGDGARGDLSHDFLMAPPDVITAAMRAAAASEEEPNEKESIAEEQHDDATVKQERELPAAPRGQKKALAVHASEDSGPVDHSPNLEEVDETSSYTSSSSSSPSSWSRWGTQEENKGSIVSTMTTTERRTLPDGTIETKRVLKKRFADGREESNESVERQSSAPSYACSAISKPSKNDVLPTGSQDKQTQTEEKENIRPKGRGWFWRE